MGLDDRINTGRLDRPIAAGDPLPDVCQQLSDRIYDWWHGAPPPLVYRTRSVPSARSLAFSRRAPVVPVVAGQLRDATNLLVKLIEHHAFDIPDHWLR